MAPKNPVTEQLSLMPADAPVPIDVAAVASHIATHASERTPSPYEIERQAAAAETLREQTGMVIPVRTETGAVTEDIGVRRARVQLILRDLREAGSRYS